MPIIRELIGMAMAADRSAGSGYGSNSSNNGAYYGDCNDYSSRGRPLDRWQLREELRHERRITRMYHRQSRRENGLIRSGVRAVVSHLGQGASGQQQSQQTQLHVYEPTQTVPAYSRPQMQSVQEQCVLSSRPAHPQYGQQAYQYRQQAYGQQGYEQQGYGQQGYVEPAPRSPEPMQESVRDMELLEPPPPYHYATRSETEKQPLPEELKR